MALSLNSTANGYLAPALGYPFKLSAQTDTFASGVVPKSTATISATFKVDKQADVHLAIYSAPLTVGTADSALLLQEDALAVTGSQYQTLTLTVPEATTLIPEPITPDGTITITASSLSVTGAATTFPKDGQWTGFEIQVKGGSWYQIASVASTTALTLTGPAATISAGSGAFLVRRPPPAAFTVVLWVDNIVGGTVETILRDTSITDASTQPQVPGGVTISSVVFT